MTTLTHTHLTTVAEYFATYPETTQPMELIEGEVIVSPAPKDIHVEAVANLLRILFAAVPEEMGKIKTAPADIVFDEYNTLQPDIFHIARDNTRCKREDDGYLHGAPDLCVEVISPGSAYRDRHKKPEIYAKHGVREYWLVELEAQFIEVHVLQENHFALHGVYRENQEVTSAILPELKFRASDIFSS